MTELLQFTLFGLMLGCVFAIAAMGLVLTYTVTGVFNFAHGAVGMICAFVYYDLRVEQHVPTPIAVLIVVVGMAPAMGIVAERLLRRFQGANYATALVVTVALTVALLGLAQKLFDPQQARDVPLLFGNHKFVIADIPITYDRVAMVVIAVAVAFALRFLLFGTPVGARMRSMVDDRELARLSGVHSVAVGRLSWMIGFSLAGLGGVLFAGGQNLNAIVLTLLVLDVYGAAMVGRLTSLPMTFVGALALGLFEELTNVHWLWPQSSEFFIRLRLTIPGIFLVVAILLVPSFRLRAGRIVGRDQPRIPTLRRSLMAAVAFVAVVAVVVHLVPTGDHVHVIRALVTATIALSLVALTGLSGQVSLTQYLFVGLGAYVTGATFGGHSVLGMLLGGVASAALGVLVALPAARLRGLHVALTTFGVALIGRDLLLGDTHVFGVGGHFVGRPSVLGISTSSDTSFAVWCSVVFVVLAVGVGVIRRSWYGRALTAVRDSELAAATLGMRVRSAKVVIFAVSGFIAGCAGALFGGMVATAVGTHFDPLNSLIILLFAFVGGITTVTGAVLAGVVFALLSWAQTANASLTGVVFLAIGAAAILLGQQPDGLAGFLFSPAFRVPNLRTMLPARLRRSLEPALAASLESGSDA
jgi:branched-chain amino acid transport system permease protein